MMKLILVCTSALVICSAAPQPPQTVTMPPCAGVWRMRTLGGAHGETLIFTATGQRVIDDDSHFVADLRPGETRSWECIRFLLSIDRTYTTSETINIDPGVAVWITFGTSGIMINTQTGEVRIPAELKLDDAAKRFWEAVALQTGHKPEFVK